MRLHEILDDTSGSQQLQALLDFMLDIKAGRKKGDQPHPSGARVGKTSHNLRLASDSIQSGWLVHFTENAQDVLNQGFRGVKNHRWLGQTRSFGSERGPDGFNYAFPVPSKAASYEQARSVGGGIEPYGLTAFVFRAPHVLVWHTGDKQEQALFASASVDPKSMIILDGDANWDRFTAAARMRKWDAHGGSVPGMETPEQRKVTFRIARQPSIWWTVRNGPHAGTKAAWSPLIKKLLG